MTLTDFGGLAFSPPIDDFTRKYHLCRDCFTLFEKWIGEIVVAEEPAKP